MAKLPADQSNNLPVNIDPHSKAYIGIISTAAGAGALLGGPPGALIGAGIGVAGCSAHYIAGRRKRTGEDQS